ncbi:MAG TPA: hypothetical protein H9902_01040 [Candidatus Stackebrandtia faecavium]|nr:hypothetical protein [Candidatus Stackebrandtia faecavium]
MSKVHSAAAGPHMDGAEADQRWPQWFGRVRSWCQRVVQQSGHERDKVILVVKSAVAATAAWAVSYYAIDPAMPAFAPFAAVLLVQLTLYQTMKQSLLFVSAVVGGVLLQGVTVFGFGTNVATFLLVTLLALVLSRWRALGVQGIQVVTAAIFAFSLSVAATSQLQRLTELLEIVVVVTVGSVIGVVVNVIIFPPLRYRRAVDAVRSLSGQIEDFVNSIASDVGSNRVGDWPTEQWGRDIVELQGVGSQARSSVQFARETTYYNPRRWWAGKPQLDFRRYEQLVEHLDRCALLVMSIARTLQYRQWNKESQQDALTGFLAEYADFLTAFTRYLRVLRHLDAEETSVSAARLSDTSDAMSEHLKQVGGCEPDGHEDRKSADRTHAVLLMEAERLVDSTRYCADLLAGAEPGSVE